MIQIYINGDDLSKNGVILNPISCEINPILNGENELEMEFAIDKDGLYKHIKNNNFISVPTPDFSENQLYRIYDTKKSMSNYSITAYARHIGFDLAKSVVFSKTLTNSNGKQALDILLSGTKFTGNSDLTSLNTTTYKMRNVMNVINGSEDDSFINIYGGKISFNNYNLTINNRRGADRGVRVTFGYNLEDIEEELNFDDVITRLYPYSGDLTLSGTHYVDSPLISSIGVFEDTVEFSDITVKESTDDTEGYDTLAEAEAEMINQCNILFANGLDKITANYVVNMQDLSKTTEYKRLGYDVLEKICLGDTVHCYNKNIDIEVIAHCISYKYDCIKEEYIEIELGDFISSYVNINNNRLDTLDSQASANEDAIEDATTATNNLKVVMEANDNSIELSVSNLEKNTKASIIVLEDSIDERVTNSTFTSYRTQTADLISQKVASADFSTLIEQNDTSVGIAIHGLTNTNISFSSFGEIIRNGGLKILDDDSNTMMSFDNGIVSCDVVSAKELTITNTDKDSSFYNTLANMDEIYCPKFSCDRIFVDGTHIYDYVVKILQDKGLI